MSCYKIILATVAIIFVFSIANIDKTTAGEKRKIQALDPSYKTKIHKLDVGDDEGHVIVIFENKSVFQGALPTKICLKAALGFWTLTRKLEKCLVKAM